MQTDTCTSRLRVLFIPDSAFWVTGTIARQIAWHNPWIQPTICTPRVLRALTRRLGQLAERVDVAHFLTPHIGTALLPEFEAKVPCVTTIHHVEDQRSVDPGPRSDAVMTVCRQWHDRLLSSGVDPSKLVRVTNGVDAGLFRPAQPAESERAKLRARLGLPPDAVVIGFIGKRSSDSYSRKGTDILVQGITALRRTLPQAACLIIGPGWSEIAAQQVEHGVTCIHLPFILDEKDLAGVYRCFDVYWVTARIEGGPVPLLEAMSSGVCCITTPVGIARELVSDGENAFLAPIDDVTAFVNRTNMLARDPDLRRRMGVAARQSILEGYTWDRTTQAARALYETAIDRFRRRFPAAKAPTMPDPHAGATPWRTDELSAVPARLKSWVRAREHLASMGDLQRLGAADAASRMATRAIGCRPWDRQIWREAGPNSTLAKSYHRARMLHRTLRSLLGRRGKNAPARSQISDPEHIF
jgi:glycosyltransferase involved in cell wall biosynthesis